MHTSVPNPRIDPSEHSRMYLCSVVDRACTATPSLAYKTPPRPCVHTVCTTRSLCCAGTYGDASSRSRVPSPMIDALRSVAGPDTSRCDGKYSLLLALSDYRGRAPPVKEHIANITRLSTCRRSHLISLEAMALAAPTLSSLPPDIISLICWNTISEHSSCHCQWPKDFKELLSLARTCRFLSEPALDAIWHTLPSIWPLLLLLPEDLRVIRPQAEMVSAPAHLILSKSPSHG